MQATRRLLPAMGFALFLALSARAASTKDRAAFRLAYPPPPQGCPSRDALLRQIEARSDRVIETNDDPSTPLFTVSIEANGTTYAAHVRESEGAEEHVRTFSAKSCTDAVAGAGLIIALALDPEAKTSPIEAPTSTPSVAKPASSIAPSSSSSSLSSSPPARIAPSRGLSWTVGVGPALRVGAVPDPTFGGAVSIGLRSDRFEATIGAERTLSDTIRVVAPGGASASVRFVFTAAVATICASPFGARARWALAFCPRVSFGDVRAEPIAAGAPVEHSLWLAAELALVARVRPTRVFAFFVSGGPALAILRSHFFFSPPASNPAGAPIDAWTTPRLGAAASVGAELEF